jgi:hypothetical protein
MPRKKGELCCCVNCGRDTTSVDRICMKCKGVRGRCGKEMQGRKARHITEAKSPFDEVGEVWYNRDPNEDYHGGSIRDDI